MKEILESLSIADETKIALQESFDVAVEAKAKELAEAEAEKVKTSIEEEYQTKLEEAKQELAEHLDGYLEKVVESFVEEKTDLFEAEIQKEKYDTLVESFSKVIEVAGIDTLAIAEGVQAKKEEVQVQESEELKESKELADSLMEEVLTLKADNAKLLKMGLIKEFTEDMTDVKKEAFYKLASVVEFQVEKPEDFMGVLETISESLDSKPAKEKEKELDESVQDKKDTYTSPAKHLF